MGKERVKDMSGVEERGKVYIEQIEGLEIARYSLADTVCVCLYVLLNKCSKQRTAS